MHDDEAMDRLLRDALAAEAPRLSPGFDTRVLRQVRPRRLTPLGRGVIVAYAAVAAAGAIWTMNELPALWICAALAIAAPIAAGASAYSRRLAFGH